MTSSKDLRARLLAGERLIGTFVKTAHHQVMEILALTGLDFVVLDAEHAPFGREALDACLLAARAGNLPALVRVPDARPETLLSVLDMGAAGVVVPHMSSVDKAAAIAAAARYGGGRGVSNSHRAGRYGEIGLSDHLEAADEVTIVIGQIEDAAALDVLDDLLAVDGIDCYFIGRADLMVSLGAPRLDDPRLTGAVDRVCHAASAQGRRLGMYVSGPEEVSGFAAKGVTLFAIGSDQSALKTAVRSLAEKAKA